MAQDTNTNTASGAAEQAAYDMGAKGAPATDSERLLFEAWMRGHNWALCATWDGKTYNSDAEQDGGVDPRAMNTRRLWAAWRDRAALASAPAQPTRDLEAVIKAAADKLDAAVCCHPNAYEGAREDLSIWKRRALEAERDLRAEKAAAARLVAELNAKNGPTRMGEPATPLAYGATEYGWTDYRRLEDGDKRLMALIVSLYGNDHQSSSDLEGLLGRAFRATPAQPVVEQGAAYAALPDAPLPVFSKGPWVFKETGQDFSGAELDEAAFVAYREHAAPAAPSTPEAGGWISVDERLPAPGAPVLLDIGLRHPIRAMWAEKHSVEAADDDTDWGEYVEEHDMYYAPEGWYEWNQNEETHWKVSETPRAWRPLPASPTQPARALPALPS